MCQTTSLFSLNKCTKIILQLTIIVLTHYNENSNGLQIYSYSNVHDIVQNKIYLYHLYIIQDKMNALMLAAQFGHHEIAQLLLESGAEIEEKNNVSK